MLYRGESLQVHVAQEGRIFPRGRKPAVVPKMDGTWYLDGRFTMGITERNAVRGHHIDTGKWGGCWVSTSRDYQRAFSFATHEGEGVIYVLDESFFADAGVVAFEDDELLEPHEKEVSIRAADGGEIPLSVVVQCIPVKPAWME